MDKEKLKLIVRNMELLIDSLKAEIYSDPKQKNTKSIGPLQLDYEEVFEDYD
jgi:hypothetical protein